MINTPSKCFINPDIPQGFIIMSDFKNKIKMSDYDNPDVLYKEIEDRIVEDVTNCTNPEPFNSTNTYKVTEKFKDFGAFFEGVINTGKYTLNYFGFLSYDPLSYTVGFWKAGKDGEPLKKTVRNAISAGYSEFCN